MGLLTNKRAIVTGGASGIGAATAHLFAAEGAHVLAVDISAEGLEQFAHSANISTLTKDISTETAGAEIINHAVKCLAGIDILMNNAGIGGGSEDVASLSQELWNRVLATNLTAPFRLCQAAIPYLRESSAGRIINVASVMATHTDYGLAAYCAAKAGVTGFTRNLALELGRDQINVNAILPGAILTGMTSASLANPKAADTWARKSVFKRLGQPEDIAKAAVFLASDLSAFITGQNINVDGGMLLRT